jgi:hypothetical protein
MAIIDITFGGGDTWISTQIADPTNFILEFPPVTYTGGLLDIIPSNCGTCRPVEEVPATRFSIINPIHVIQVVN